MKNELMRRVPLVREAYRHVVRWRSDIKDGRRLRKIWEIRLARAMREMWLNGTLLDHLSGEDLESWQKRINNVHSDPANARIRRVPDAGRIIGRNLIMHNGLKVHPYSHYGREMLALMCQNGGVHEPEEELIFGQALKQVQCGGVMVELGSYWGFYSMWFKREVAGARCVLVEPEPANLRWGQRNFALNRMRGEFKQAYVGKQPDVASDGTEIVTVDRLAETCALREIDILHSDIQGAEADMLKGAHEMLRRCAIRVLFISTHSNDVHANCIARLREYDYSVLKDIDLNATLSHDGLIVAGAPGVGDFVDAC